MPIGSIVTGANFIQGSSRVVANLHLIVLNASLYFVNSINEDITNSPNISPKILMTYHNFDLQDPHDKQDHAIMTYHSKPLSLSNIAIPKKKIPNLIMVNPLRHPLFIGRMALKCKATNMLTPLISRLHKNSSPLMEDNP